jgi:cytochrome b
VAAQSLFIWPWWVRLTHWALVVVFVANYFLLDPGSWVHTWLGYGVTLLIVARIVLGFSTKNPYASLRSLDLNKKAFLHHLQELKARHLSPAEGHNPLGWLMVFLFWALMLVLAVTGFLAEEVDYFFGNQLLDEIHVWAADAMLIAALIHIASVFLVGFWGHIPLVRPMITGCRKTDEKPDSSSR